MEYLPLKRLGVIGLLLGLLLFSTGCGWLLSSMQLASQPPRMTCPTPTAVATIQVEDGRQVVNGTPTARYRDTEPYEIEYGQPVITPTPYIRESATFPIGTIINLGGSVDAMLDVAPREVTRQEGGVLERLYRITVQWNNPGTPLTFDPNRQLAIAQIQGADGRIRSGTWRWSADSAAASDLPVPASPLETQVQIPTGPSTMTIDLFAPEGQVRVAELRLDAAVSDGSDGVYEDMRVQFVANAPDPNCTTNGLLNPAGDPARQEAQPVVVPAGTNAVVAAALGQLGRPYCWGGKGFNPCNGCGGGKCYEPCNSYPCFDCSGLTKWAWAAVGVNIGDGSSGQQRNATVPRGEAMLPGDLLFFYSGPGSGRINHVTLYGGDVNGNGTADMVEASWYGIPLRIVDNWQANTYYAQRFAWAARPNG